MARFPMPGSLGTARRSAAMRLITALEMLWIDPAIAQGVLKLPRRDPGAPRCDPAADAEPGKILHETRQGEMARLGEIPFGRYYGSVDATPLFVLLAGMYLERTGDLATVGGALAAPGGGAALDRPATAIATATDSSSTAGAANAGSVNQGWKDSHDSVFHADGRLAQGPIALCEVQAYVYARQAPRRARWPSALGHGACAGRPGARRPPTCEQRFEKAFWCEEIGTYALALDGEKHPCRCAPPMPGTRCSPASPIRARARRRRRPADERRLLQRLGHPHRGRLARPATIRCRITTARSGRTTTR